MVKYANLLEYSEMGCLEDENVMKSMVTNMHLSALRDGLPCRCGCNTGLRSNYVKYSLTDLSGAHNHEQCVYGAVFQLASGAAYSRHKVNVTPSFCLYDDATYRRQRPNGKTMELLHNAVVEEGVVPSVDNPKLAPQSVDSKNYICQ